MNTDRLNESARAGERLAAESTRTVEKMPVRRFWLAAVGSMGVSALLFALGKRQASNFVGLWVPSLISLALFYRLLRPSREMRRTGSHGYQDPSRAAGAVAPGIPD
ncbi:MAG: hypothetical protein GEU28_09585 [Dehalococcoidia bacterium]|nr:hypothetical protein [Dehalococcoidia bacterium]